MPLATLKRKGYCLQRSASHGASLTLINHCGELRAEFECAIKCAEILGNRDLIDLGDGILDNIPCFRIATEDLFSALTKLTQRFSVALVEYTMTRKGGMFICLWRINSSGQGLKTIDDFLNEPGKPQASKNLDDY